MEVLVLLVTKCFPTDFAAEFWFGVNEHVFGYVRPFTSSE